MDSKRKTRGVCSTLNGGRMEGEAGFSSGLLYVCLTSDKTWLTRANEVGRASSFADEALIRLDAIWSRHLTALRLVP